MIIQEYRELEENNKYKGIDFRKFVTEQCVDIALRTNFPTDYNDVYEHLFGREDFLKLFLIIDREIKGFIVSDTYEGKIMALKKLRAAYIQGIILDHSIQGNGYFKKLVSEVIKRQNSPLDYISLRTHNPSCASAFTKSISDDFIIYPTVNKIDEDVLEIVRSDRYIGNANENLVVENAYSNVLLQQSTANEQINELFRSVGDNDAQCVIGVSKVLRRG